MSHIATPLRAGHLVRAFSCSVSGRQARGTLGSPDHHRPPPRGYRHAGSSSATGLRDILSYVEGGGSYDRRRLSNGAPRTSILLLCPTPASLANHR